MFRPDYDNSLLSHFVAIFYLVDSVRIMNPDVYSSLASTISAYPSLS